VTFEARLASILVFFAIWCIVGLMPWAIAAVITRGRGAFAALPLALAGACVFGVAVPLAGARDAAGFFLSLLTAAAGGTLGTIAGIGMARRIESGRSAPPRQAPPLTRRVVEDPTSPQDASAVPETPVSADE
jgi:hypothetical protein